MISDPIDILQFESFYFVGVKGVAMTSLAQCLLEAGKQVRGSDVAEKFVTQAILDRCQITVDEGFTAEIPPDVQCVVYTSAHQAQLNPQVVAAQARSIPTLSQAQAIASLFNQKKGIAVCGVGGKSTTSAMVTWILEKIGVGTSFSVGVGNIPGLEKTGQWQAASDFFVAEADEYVIDPSAAKRGEEITPRFSFMRPFVTICTNIRYDHPDVYRDFEHTKTTYKHFFSYIPQDGMLIVHDQDQATLESMYADGAVAPKMLFVGESEHAQVRLLEYTAEAGVTTSRISFQGKEYLLKLKIPGKYNVMNALCAVAASIAVGVSIEDALAVLADFRSTMRRGEFIGEKNGVKYYDDYAHHPNEVKSVITAFREWFPNQRLVVGFQSHTFSRTKALFSEFIEAFALADEVVMIDIFASAREAFDPSMTSELLCQEIEERFTKIPAHNVKTIENLAQFCQEKLRPGDVFLTVGAGDIYKVHQAIS